jgi:hypothetical protein
MHRLQAQFETVDGEHDYVCRVKALIENGALAEADALLQADLMGIDNPIANTARATPAHAVNLTGWGELSSSIAQYEGDDIAAITIGIGNDPDLAFEKQPIFDPYVMLGLYANSAYDFEQASNAAIKAECASEEPAWAGQEEDIEVYLEVEGLGPLNTALIRHKNQYFFRDAVAEGEGIAPVPMDYIAFTLACLVRTLRFHQAIRARLDNDGLPTSIPVIAGMINMRHDVTTVHKSAKHAEIMAQNVASLVIKPKVAIAAIPQAPSGNSLRQRIANEIANEDAAEPKPQPRKSFMGRLIWR